MASSVVLVWNGSIWASFTGTVDVSELSVQIARSWSTFGIEATALDKAIEIRVGWAILASSVNSKDLSISRLASNTGSVVI